MKLIIRIDSHTFNARVGNVNERPILVEVDGDIFEVWPEQNLAYEIPDVTEEELQSNTVTQAPAQENMPSIATKNSLEPHPNNFHNQNVKYIRAPIPGIITSVNVTNGSEVTVGKELLKLEAMKMNNSIHSNHAGIIRTVNISVGQKVKRHQVLLEFE